jgi:DNA-binding NarL/FixJ family response regulator
MPKQPAPPAKSGKTRIVIVDDHPLLRTGLAARLRDEPDLAVCGQAGDLAEAMAVIDRERPDLVLVDISLPGRDGLELLKDIRARHPPMLTLVLSMHDESLYAERALRAGARGYVMKGAAPETLVQAIRDVVAGELVVGKEIVKRVLQRVGQTGTGGIAGSPVDRLTDRELEVFRLIGEGHNRNRIANELHLSVKTVEAHRANIRQKLGAENAAEVMQRAVRFVQCEAGR